MISRLSFACTSLAMLVPALVHAQVNTVPELPQVPAEARQAAASISPEKISAHVRFLSDDLLEGRGPGLRGAEIAAQYIATQFMLSGLKPAGENGTYFQKVPLIAVHTIEDQTTFSFEPKNGGATSLKYGEDYVTKDETGAATADIDAPIVFVGYGIDAPEYKWNDYKDVDVKGKVLLVIVNEPQSQDEAFFKGKAMTYYGRWTYKYEEAARKGAVGVLIIHRTDLASYGWEVVRNSQSIEKSYLQNDPLSTLQAASWIQLDVAQKLLGSVGIDAEKAIDAAGKPGFKAIELPVRLKAHVASKVRKYESTNVIAMLPGTSQQQAVFYTAHYDHLGIDRDLKGDNIYNGAADNASGCGILLEIARAYAEASVKPPHPIYFAAVTAEEQGLLGSQYLGMHPPDPCRADFTRPEFRHAYAARHSHVGGSGWRRADHLLSHSGEDCRSLSTWNWNRIRRPAQATTTGPITSAWLDSACRPSLSDKERSFRGTMRIGAGLRPRISYPSITISHRTSFILTGTSVA